MKDFRTSKTLKMLVPNEAVPIEHYLRQPQRLIHAITDSRRIEQLEESIYRVWTQSDGTLRLQSVACEVKVPDYLSYVNQSFSMSLEGTLRPQRQEVGTELNGKAELAVQVELPAPIKFMPDSMLDSAGRTFLNGILSTIQHSIERQLVGDYREWAVSNQSRSITTSPGKFRSNPAQ